MQDKVDILRFSSSGLATLKWKQCEALPVNMQDAQAVWLAEKLYVGGGYTEVEHMDEDYEDQARLYIYSPNTDVWDIVHTPVYWFALVAYRSQVVLVGGDDKKRSPSLTNKLFSLRSTSPLWEEALPPLPKSCRSPSAVNFQHYLIVACGSEDEGRQLDIVQVFDGEQWSIAPGPPMTCYDIKSAVLDGVWYLTGSQQDEQTVYCTRFDLLIASCLSEFSEESPWKSFPAVPYEFCSLAVFGNRLVAIGGEERDTSTPTRSIHAYSPNTDLWIHVANLYVGLYSTCAIVLPSGELMIIGGMCRSQVYKASIVGYGHMDYADIKAELTQDLKNILQKKKEDDVKEKVVDFVRKLASHCHLEVEYGSGNDSEKEWMSYEHLTQVEKKPLALFPVKKEVKEEAATVTKDETTSGQPTAAWDLRGVEVCGEMTVVVHSSGAQQITWEGFGLKLHIDEGSLPAGIHQCTLTIKASLAGQYEFPDNSYLVSAIFWLRCEPMCKFTKPVVVEMQHCARSENVTNLKLKFVRAVCSQKQLPYTFKELGGDFTSHSSYGVVEVNGFSGLAITQEGSSKRNYLANLFSKEVKDNPTRVIVEIFFVVIWNTNAHLTAMQSHHRFKDAQLVTDQPIAFESEQVEFQISNTSRHWKILRINSAVVRKEDVDSFTLLETSWIPHSHFKAKYFGDSSVIHDLECAVDIVGARRPHNTLTIDISPKGPIAGPQWCELPLLHTSDSMATRLSRLHLSSLLQQLYEHAARWRDIGGALGFTQGELDTIQAKPFLLTGGPKSWLGSMLSDWLQWAPGDGRGSTHFATLEKLKDALNQANLGATAHTLHL